MRTILIGDTFYEVCPRCGMRPSRFSAYGGMSLYRRWECPFPRFVDCAAICGKGLCDARF